MMKKFLTILTLASAPIVAAHADPHYMHSGFYVTGDAGYGYLFTPNSDQNSPTTTGSYSHGGLAGSLGGGYRWALDSFSALGVEVDYLYNGKATYNNNPATLTAGGTSYNGTATITSQGAALMGVWNSQWTNGMNGFLKAGMAYISQKQSYSSPAVVAGSLASGSNTNTGFQFIAALGVGYMITQSINLFIQGTYIAGDSGGSWTPTSSTQNNIVQNAQLTGGLSYYF